MRQSIGTFTTGVCCLISSVIHTTRTYLKWNISSSFIGVFFFWMPDLIGPAWVSLLCAICMKWEKKKIKRFEYGDTFSPAPNILFKQNLWQWFLCFVRYFCLCPRCGIYIYMGFICCHIKFMQILVELISNCCFASFLSRLDFHFNISAKRLQWINMKIIIQRSRVAVRFFPPNSYISWRKSFNMISRPKCPSDVSMGFIFFIYS